MKKDKKKKKSTKEKLSDTLKQPKSAASSLRKNLRTATSATKEFKLAQSAKPTGISDYVKTSSDKSFKGPKTAKTKDFSSLKTSTASKDSIFKKVLKKKKKK